LFQVLVVAVLVAETLAIGQGSQGSQVASVLAELRQALGGEQALAAVKTVAIEGTRTRVVAEGQSRGSAFEMAMELPGRFVQKQVLGNFNGIEITRTSGFSQGELIEKADTPPQMGGGHMVIRMASGGMVGGEPTPEQLASQQASQLASVRRDFARLALGMFGAGTEAVPLEFAYAGLAESPETKAHVLAVTGPDGFEAKLFVDTTSHLPLMLSWMDKEPVVMQVGGPGTGGLQVFQRGGGSPQDAERVRAGMEQRMREAEANRRVVEYRLFYADYKVFDGVRFPTRLQRMIDGSPVEETAFEKVKVNGKLDPKIFEK
jgi:hypothetical protein